LTFDQYAHHVEPADKPRCIWAASDPLYLRYHDCEWGVPLHDDCRLFEFLVLEGAQAGLSWLTILKKRSNYRQAFDFFDPSKVAAYDSRKIDQLLSNQGIVRNRLKVEAAVRNARAFLSVQAEYGSFDRYIWRFTGGNTIKNAWRTEAEIPAFTKESEAMSKDLKHRGFGFVGPTVCYAVMQAAGMVNDHVIRCFRYQEV
jgi:DNA-3-methyladenine glycosylase I